MRKFSREVDMAGERATPLPRPTGPGPGTAMHDESPDRQEIDPGSVRLTFTVGSAPGVVWQALTDADRLRDWFGRLLAPLRDAGSTVLDFGDGDFFTLHDIRLRPRFA